MVDTKHDYRKDCNYPKQDPDKYSFKLKQDHAGLWSKELPIHEYGKLELKPKHDRIEAYVNDEYFDFGCDSITNCYCNRKDLKEFREDEEVQKLLKEYYDADYVIGSSIIFPLKRDDGKTKWTINQARGCLRKISDRIDLTLECIRIFYLNRDQCTPLRSCLINYSRFFNLFGNFENYVKFFLLNDLVSEDYKTIVGFTDVLDFEHALPDESIEQYKEYIRRNIDFIKKRNERIKNHCLDKEWSCSFLLLSRKNQKNQKIF